MIKQILETEIPRCVEVIQTSFKETLPEYKITSKNATTYGAFITNTKLKNTYLNGSMLYGFYDSAIQVGFAQVTKLHNGDYELTNLCTLPWHKGRGVATQLLDYVKNKVKLIGGHKITIGIIDENATLKQWFTKRGFVETGTHKFPYMPFTVCYMELKI